MEKLAIYKKTDQLPRGTKIIDGITGAKMELKKLATFLKIPPLKPVYAYYPWVKIAIRIPQEKVYFELRTARNKNIITRDEQMMYRNTAVGVAGMSVGSNVISALVFSGGPKFIKIADYDKIEFTNLNRLRAPLYAIFENKANVAARMIWELDPFAQIEIWNKGLDKNTLHSFIAGRKKLDIFIDEIDNLELKFLARLICRAMRIPVVMVTDNGDNVIIDIERFDKEPRRKILHGLVRESDYKNFNNLSDEQWLKIALKIVDVKNLTPRMQSSIQQIGKTLSAVPQLGTTASVAGAAAAYVARRIATNQKMPSGRYFIGLDNIFN